jgi:hypothetical protein
MGDNESQYYATELALKAAPYLHPKLANTEISGKIDERLVVQIVRYSPEEKLVTAEPLHAIDIDPE